MIKYVRFFPGPRIVLVNMDGRRFQNEAAPPAPGNPTGPLENQPQHKAYAIFDSLTTEKMGAELLERSQGDPGLYRGMVSWRELRRPHTKRSHWTAALNKILCLSFEFPFSASCGIFSMQQPRTGQSSPYRTGAPNIPS